MEGGKIGLGSVMHLMQLAGLCLFLGACVQSSDAQEPDSAKAASYMHLGVDLGSREQFDSSNVFLAVARGIYEKLKRIDEGLYCSNRIADNNVRQGRYHEAARELRRADSVERAEGKTNGAEAVQTFTLKGYLAICLDSATTALTHLRHSLALAHMVHGSRSVAVGNCNYMLGLAFQKAGEIDSALVYLEKALEIHYVQEEKHPLEIAMTMSVLGNLLRTKGEVDRAVQLLRESLSELQGGKFAGNMALCSLHVLLGSAYSERGELQNAIAQFDTALSLSRIVYGDDHIFTTSIYTSLGEAYSEAGEWSRAAKCIDVAIQRMVQHYGPRHSNLARLYDILARDYYFHDSLAAGKAAIDKAIALQTELLGRRQGSLARMYETKGLIEQKQGHYRKALASFDQAREIFSSLGNENGSQAVTLLVDASTCYLALGFVDSSASVLHKALSTRTDGFSPDSRQQSSIWNQLGEVYKRGGHPKEALQAFDKAMLAARGRGNGSSGTRGVTNAQEYADAALKKVRLLQEVGHREGARSSILPASIALCREVIHVLEMSRQTLREEDSKITFSQKALPFSEAGMEASLAMWRLTGETAYKDTAFGFAEYGRSRVLVEALDREAALRASGVPERVTSRERELVQAIAALNVVLHRSKDGPFRDQPRHPENLEAKQLGLMQELSRLQDSVREAFPLIQELTDGSESVDLQTVRSALPEHASFVEYVQGKRNVYAFILRAQDLMVIDLGSKQGLGSLVAEYLTSIRTVRLQSYPHSAYALYRKLVLPLEKDLAKTKHLIIAPEWSFATIPFEAFLTSKVQDVDGGNQGDFSRLPYLINRYTISYTYSLSFLRKSQQRIPRQDAKDKFAVFAPIFDQAEFYPADDLGGKPTPEALVASRSARLRNPFGNLPYSREESESLGELFTQAGRAADVHLGREARESSFKSDCSRYQYIHLATHGVTHPGERSHSALVFSEAVYKEGAEDGLLYAEEVYGLNLNAKLVVLSSCESGVGKVYQGEGLVALARGFFYAGAQRVVSSLWKVRDGSTKELMVRFYKDALHGQRFADSLRRAKLALISSPLTCYPRDWAGFVLIGM